jgi:hypothetical protein
MVRPSLVLVANDGREMLLWVDVLGGVAIGLYTDGIEQAVGGGGAVVEGGPLADWVLGR